MTRRQKDQRHDGLLLAVLVHSADIQKEPDRSRGFTGEAGQACSPLALLCAHWLQQRQRQGQNWR